MKTRVINMVAQEHDWNFLYTEMHKQNKIKID